VGDSDSNLDEVLRGEAAEAADAAQVLYRMGAASRRLS
jgi:uncharacterized membrane-anchored protein